ncbi:ATP-dependent Clp protease adapter ClpS [Rothia halotolerans]|jgi:ATP-dependent Clp protease adaptor protein ClpS|uniref:ATP-dependent Clp protease adapter ClpS n=1 Tax=Rothia halotolerans TaxID=405770 RepID=UPI00101D5736|nr:ATP-dependent Clp protease adapter ClpS [Rothia halotolerans]
MVTLTSTAAPVDAEGLPETVPEGEVGLLERSRSAPPWKVVVWNDPVNLMSYVTFVFRSYFGFSEEKARQLMLAVHEQGSAVVFTGGREEAERHTTALHGYGLWATFAQEGE